MVVVSRKLQGVHMGFLMQVTGHKAKQQKDRTRRRASAMRVLKEAGNQTLGMYIDERNVTVAKVGRVEADT